MPAHSTCPTLLDQVKQISITKLKEWQYLESGIVKSGIIRWSRNGNKTGSISILSDMNTDHPFIELSYKYDDEEIKYRIEIVSKTSNLGIGKIWYFVCPHTGKWCRKLYGAGKYFLHRDAYPHAMYECQTYSKNMKEMDRAFSFFFSFENLWQELHSKYFTTHYKGKPTKRYKQILRELELIRQNQDQALKIFMS